MNMPRQEKLKIWKRDGFACRYCGARGAEATLTVDHIVPRSKGGTNSPRNLQTLCRPCNTLKGAGPDLLGRRSR